MCKYKVCVFVFQCPCYHLQFSGVLCCVHQVLTAEQQRAFCRIGAIIRGFLTRRLLKTEKVKHLRQTIVVSSRCVFFYFIKCYIKDHTKNLYEYVYICLLRTQRSSSIRSRVTLRTEAPTQHKITLCRRELEPRYEAVFSTYRQQRSIFHYV